MQCLSKCMVKQIDISLSHYETLNLGPWRFSWSDSMNIPLGLNQCTFQPRHNLQGMDTKFFLPGFYLKEKDSTTFFSYDCNCSIVIFIHVPVMNRQSMLLPLLHSWAHTSFASTTTSYTQLWFWFWLFSVHSFSWQRSVRVHQLCGGWLWSIRGRWLQWVRRLPRLLPQLLLSADQRSVPRAFHTNISTHRKSRHHHVRNQLQSDSKSLAAIEGKWWFS